MKTEAELKAKFQVIQNYYSPRELTEKFYISPATQKNYLSQEKRSPKKRGRVPARRKSAQARAVELIHFTLAEIESHPGVNPKKELEELKIENHSFAEFVHRFKDSELELVEIAIKEAIELRLKGRELENPLDEFRKKYTYLDEQTLDSAVEECPELVKRIILDESVRPLARALALLALASGVDREKYFNDVLFLTSHPSPFIRESAFMGLFEFYDQEERKHLELKKFFEESLEKEKAVGIKTKIASLLQRM